MVFLDPWLCRKESYKIGLVCPSFLLSQPAVRLSVLPPVDAFYSIATLNFRDFLHERIVSQIPESDEARFLKEVFFRQLRKRVKFGPGAEYLVS